MLVPIEVLGAHIDVGTDVEHNIFGIQQVAKVVEIPFFFLRIPTERPDLEDRKHKQVGIEAQQSLDDCLYGFLHKSHFPAQMYAFSWDCLSPDQEKLRAIADRIDNEDRGISLK